MNKNKLSARMLMNIGLIPVGKRVADIGCDHGYVAMYLVQEKLASKVFALDVAAGPLNRARINVKNAGLEDVIDIRLSDGVEKLAVEDDGCLEADVLLMAGIGGHLAIRIIEDNIDKCRRTDCIVLQPQSDIEFVRRRVIELGFKIDAEDMTFEDGKYYSAMRISKNNFGEKLFYEDYIYKYGPDLIEKKHPVLKQFLMYKRDSFEAIKENISSNSLDVMKKDRIQEIDAELEMINEIWRVYV